MQRPDGTRGFMKHDIEKIVTHFQIEGKYLDGCPYGSGHINDTYRTRWQQKERIYPSLQQRINHTVFRKPQEVMENILRVTRHLHEKLSALAHADPDREALTVVPSRDGRFWYTDPEGNYWRTYLFIENAQTYNVCENPQQAEEAARSFGRFQNLLTDLPGGPLHETIPFFHHTPRRFQTLEEAIAGDTHNRAASAGPEIAFALHRKEMVSTVTALMENGRIPTRITHNDTKLNNVMIDDRSGKGICVIDLDTVMGGSALYDFGDLVRTCTPTSAEDELDLDQVHMRLDLFEALAHGYLAEATFLNPVEIDLLAFAGRLITFNIGIRFLTDYLVGDTYFKIHRPGHNLDRARVQFKMIEEMEIKEKEMQRIVRRYAAGN
jgi:hypothetical protein